MSYTLRGRLESRLAALLPPLVAALRARGRAARLVAGRARGADDRRRRSRSTSALPPPAPATSRAGRRCRSGCSSSALRDGARAARSGSRRRSGRRCALFARRLARRAGCSATRCCRCSGSRYAEDGGELGRAGAARWPPSPAPLAAAGGLAWAHAAADRAPAAGVHQGPLVIDRREHLVGEPGAVVRGGIVDPRRRRDRSATSRVVGGENGIDVDGRRRRRARPTCRSRARRSTGSTSARAAVTIRDCSIDMRRHALRPGHRHLVTASTRSMSMVEGCTVVGGQRGHRHALRERR